MLILNLLLVNRRGVVDMCFNMLGADFYMMIGYVIWEKGGGVLPLEIAKEWAVFAAVHYLLHPLTLCSC